MERSNCLTQDEITAIETGRTDAAAIYLLKLAGDIWLNIIECPVGPGTAEEGKTWMEANSDRIGANMDKFQMQAGDEIRKELNRCDLSENRYTHVMTSLLLLAGPAFGVVRAHVHAHKPNV